MSKQLSSVLLSLALLGAALLAVAAGAATALPSPHRVTLHVSSSAAQTGTQATYRFAFSGSEVSGFELSLPSGVELRSERFRTLGRYLALRDPADHPVRYELMEARNQSVSLDLADVSARFTVLFNADALRFSAAEQKLISDHRVTHVTLTFTFMGSAQQFATAKMILRV